MTTTQQKYRNRHRLNTFLNGLQLVVNSVNIKGSITTSSNNVFRSKLTSEEIKDLHENNVLHKPITINNTTTTYQLGGLKVKIKFKL